MRYVLVDRLEICCHAKTKMQCVETQIRPGELGP